MASPLCVSVLWRRQPELEQRALPDPGEARKSRSILSKPEVVAYKDPFSRRPALDYSLFSRVPVTPSLAGEVGIGLLRVSKPSETFTMVVAGKSKPFKEVWSISEGEISGVYVASWVVKEGKKALHFGLVGY